ncbi:MAG TPA: SPOR domain-containing protein [Bryobacteraceae bacterium]|nr:SPOR domain-containing protein [Bryobacteraceae bacterium]
MATNEDGEFELILGNRQLLSMFFIVVILLGVFFTMGYIVGRNSSPAGPADTARNSKPIAIDSPTANPNSESASSETMEPAKPKSAKPDPVQTPSVKHPAKTPEFVRTEKSAESAASESPQSGQAYLQVAAVGKSEAELFVDVLGKKGFRALYAPVPGSSVLFRVLVGPVKDASSIAKTRTDLQTAGFKGYDALVRKY